ncbi:MAG: hypothetical protein P4L83_21420 [Nevskia sp.]|nr:hypothetical protein [Nevskia sp.]
MRSSSHTMQASVLGMLLLANGAFMVAAPEAWYHAVPTVPDTGPFNPHFVRDIGCAFATAALGLLWFARDAAARPAALAASVFLGLHALTHVWDLLAGRESVEHFAVDGVLVILPALWAGWLARPLRSTI